MAAASRRLGIDSNYLPTLDGWRALAILGVMICHSCDALFHADGPHPNAVLHALTRHGALGVDVFFGISGFLICTRLIEEHKKNGHISLKRFYIRRAFRILPPYFTYLAVLGVLAAAGLIFVAPTVWWSCLLFFRNYLPVSQAGRFYTGHCWSLSIEEHFYLLWPTLLVLWGIGRARRWVVVLAGAVACWRVFEFRHQWLGQVIGGVGFFPRTDVRFDGLLWGCWAALMLASPTWRAVFHRWLCPSVWLGLVAAFIACVYYQPPLGMVWQALLIPLILVGTVLRPDTGIGRFLEAGPMQWIGRLSYSLYLWNSLFFPVMDNPRPLPLGHLQELPWSILPVFACASVSYYLAERPMIRLGHSLASRIARDERQPVEAKLRLPAKEAA